MPMTDQQRYERDARTLTWDSCGKDGRDSVDTVFDRVKGIVRDGNLKYLEFNDKSVSVEKFLSAKLSKQARYRAGVRLYIGRQENRFDFSIIYHSVEPFDRIGSKDFRSGLHAHYPEEHDQLIKRHLCSAIASKDLIFSWNLQWALRIKNQSIFPISYLGMQTDQYDYYKNEAGVGHIDHYRSPFRVFGRNEGYIEAIGSEMWCGPSFWMITDAKLDDIRALDGVVVSILPNNVAHIRANRPFKIGDEQIDLAIELRRRLFPKTYFLDREGNDRRR